MSAQGRERARSTQTSEVAQLSSTGDTARVGAGSTQERLGNSEMAARLGLRGVSQEAEPASAKVQRPAWLGEAGAGEEEMSAPGTIDPRLYRLSLPKASRRLERAMAAFEARMRPADEAAWAEWYSKEWKSIVGYFNTINGTEVITAANPKVHATQSRRQNRANDQNYADSLEQLLAGDKLFTWNDYKDLWDVHYAANKDQGNVPWEAARGNGTDENRSNATGLVSGLGYDSKSSADIKKTLTTLNNDDIEFQQANPPTDVTAGDFPAFALANCYITDKKSAEAKLRPVADYLRKNRSRSIRVIGRSNFDLTPMNIPDAGRTMGLARAMCVRDLLTKLGVKPGQIKAEGKQIEIYSQELGVELILEP